MEKIKLYFLGYFLVFPVILMVSFLLWRLVIKNNEAWIVLTDSLSILGIYYLLVSIFFTVFAYKQTNTVK